MPRVEPEWAGLAGGRAGPVGPPQLLAVSVVGHDDARRGSRPGAAAPVRERLAGGCWGESNGERMGQGQDEHTGATGDCEIGRVPPQYSVSIHLDVERSILVAWQFRSVW